METRYRLALIGCGRVGLALTGCLSRIGHEVIYVRDTKSSAERRARRLFGLGQRKGGSLREADVLFLGVPDREIARVAAGLGPELGGQAVLVHFSGALSSSVLAQAGPARGRLALHPVMTFPVLHGIGQPSYDFTDKWFALEGNTIGLGLGRRLVQELGGHFITLKPEDKALFHAGCVFASNLLVALLDAAYEVVHTCQVPRHMVAQLLEPLVRTSLDNVLQTGTAEALSGPIERGDCLTVEGHLQVLGQRTPGLVPVYRELSRRAVELAKRKGSLSQSQAGRMIKALDKRLSTGPKVRDRGGVSKPR